MAGPGYQGPHMITNTPMDFAFCKTFLGAGLQNGTLRHVDAMAHLLGIGTRSPWFYHCEDYLCLNEHMSAQIVSLDAEWYESNRRHITELGLAGVSVFDARFATSTKFTDLLATMGVNHVRIKENAHMVNGRRCEGNPTKFQFGSTGFVTYQQGRGVINAHMMQPIDGLLRPIVLIGHAVGNDVQEFKDHFGIDLNLYPVLMTLDTQVMAKELGIERHRGRKTGLHYLLNYYGIRDNLYLHNAGNDASLTMIVACIMANDRFSRPGHNNPQTQTDTDNLKAQIQQRNSVLACGDKFYCTRCDGDDHLASGCTAELSCERCQEHNPNQANSHKIDKCLLVHPPCKHCANAEPWNAKIRENADTHTTEDCMFRQSTY